MNQHRILSKKTYAKCFQKRRATMKRHSIFYAIIALFTLLILTNEGNCFAGANDIKARMQNRLPSIVKLKSDGLVGENNKGYLEFVPGAAKKDANIIAAENNDRQAVYGAIAKQQGTTPKLVGERRAKQIGQKASSGSWLQDSSGKWYRK
jgi:uncharacterized protein YdbL (DUF1318 family)